MSRTKNAERSAELRRYKPYPAYKDSGVEWLGEIPGHWEVKPLKHLTTFATGWTPPTGREDLYGGDHLWANIGDLGPKVLCTTEKTISDMAIREARMRIASAGSLLFSFKLSVGTVSIAGVDMYTNEAIAAFEHSERIDTGYLYWAAPMLVPQNAQVNIYGAALLNRDRIANATLLGPPLPEQRTIAAFLDRETARSDALVANKERLIELLQEKRTALITHAVTKGLDPTAPTKPSGIDWLGDIPAHWEACKPKFVTTRIVDGVHHTPEYVDEGIPFVTVRNLTALPNTISFEHLNYVSREAHAELIKRAKPERGDLLITKDGTLGVPRVVDTDREFSIFVSVALLKLVRESVDPNFLRLVFESQTTKAQTQSRKLGSALTHLHLGELANLYFALPPLNEQRELVTSLSAIMGALDSLGDRVREGVDRLKEFRTALISAAVTGKIDVREEVE